MKNEKEIEEKLAELKELDTENENSIRKSYFLEGAIQALTWVLKNDHS